MSTVFPVTPPGDIQAYLLGEVRAWMGRRGVKGPVYVVVGQVDSENGFGALIRNDYRCKVRSTGGDRYRLVKLSGLAN